MKGLKFRNKSLENKIGNLLEEAKRLKMRIIREQKGIEEEINTDALHICPSCGKRNLVLYTEVNQPSKLFCLGCGRYWVETR